MLSAIKVSVGATEGERMVQRHKNLDLQDTKSAVDARHGVNSRKE